MFTSVNSFLLPADLGPLTRCIISAPSCINLCRMPRDNQQLDFKMLHSFLPVIPRPFFAVSTQFWPRSSSPYIRYGRWVTNVCGDADLNYVNSGENELLYHDFDML